LRLFLFCRKLARSAVRIERAAVNDLKVGCSSAMSLESTDAPMAFQPASAPNEFGIKAAPMLALGFDGSQKESVPRAVATGSTVVRVLIPSLSLRVLTRPPDLKLET
jgi:hypothetical protein